MSKFDFQPNSEKAATFYWWMRERHSIYLKKTAGENPPWTDDPAMREYKFTNVFRRLDRGTVFYHEAIRGELLPLPQSLLLNTIIYRMVNNVETFEECGLWRTNGATFIAKMRRRRDRGDKVFTSAHMTVGVSGEDKLETNIRAWRDAHRQIASLYYALLDCNGSLQEAFRELLAWKIFGVGKFIAYEIISDLRWWMWKDITDALTWANPGPGCRRGLLRLGLIQNWNDPEKKCVEAMIALWRGRPSLDTHLPFELREIEHSLCEFDKWCRVTREEGAPREKYRYQS